MLGRNRKVQFGSAISCGALGAQGRRPVRAVRVGAGVGVENLRIAQSVGGTD
jgi:hypothetical protein